MNKRAADRVRHAFLDDFVSTTILLVVELTVVLSGSIWRQTVLCEMNYAAVSSCTNQHHHQEITVTKAIVVVLSIRKAHFIS